ncbi:hypothetical protein BDB00DRAFT_634199 [Zychaea mexicana]|uniref:uncharacterized protein n=1 Tax=Zychaea mexicana TaxID=64656 RepID=UPI0022FEB384|nr:uncharacterized protein BDB00DRAFT_634199 [Zychaea mexicana]KAI9489248.1 hypothetical protein BDB00DRAFT_634199 [Zychaea mexicana]
MSIQELPPEIILAIAHHLPSLSRLTCILVCRQWQTLFLPTLYSSVHITRRHALRSFLATMERLPWLGKDVVRELILRPRNILLIPDQQLDYTVSMRYGRGVGITSEQLAIIQQLCPHLEVLDFKPELWTHLKARKRFSIRQEEGHHDDHANGDGDDRDQCYKYHCCWPQRLRYAPPFDRKSIFESFVFHHPHQLARLELIGSYVHTIRNWEQLLSRVPLLRHLILNCQCITLSLLPRRPDPHYSTNSPIPLDTIIQYAPHLETLDLCGVDLDIVTSTASLEPAITTTSTTPSSSSIPTVALSTLNMKTVFFKSDNVIQYIAQALAHRLHTLTMVDMIRIGGNSIEQEHQQQQRRRREKQDIYIELALACHQRLKSLSLNDISQDTWKLQFLYHIRPRSLETLCLRWLRRRFTVPEVPSSMSRDVFDLAISLLSPSKATGLAIPTWPAINHVRDMIQPLLQFKHLQTLEIIGSKDNSLAPTFPAMMDTLALDIVLQLPALTHLTLAFVNIIVENDDDRQQQDTTVKGPSPSVLRRNKKLKSLELYRTIIQSSLFDYLGATCPDLVDLSLCALWCCIQWPVRKGFLIQLPEHRLKTVKMTGLRLVYYLEKTKHGQQQQDAANIIGKDMGDCSILGVERIGYNKHTLARKQRRQQQEQLRRDTEVSDKKSSSYYCQCDDNKNNKSSNYCHDSEQLRQYIRYYFRVENLISTQLLRLSPQDISLMERFEAYDGDDLENNLFHTDLLGAYIRRSFQHTAGTVHRDKEYGYIHLRCHSIDACSFEHNVINY